MPTNQLKGINFTRLDNGRVTVGSQTVSSPQNVPLTGGPQETTIFVSRVNAGQPVTVHFEVSDACSTPWPTFVGAGAGAL